MSGLYPPTSATQLLFFMPSLKILLSGGSSFSGYHIVQTLAQAGHDVWTTLQSSPESYQNQKARRIQSLGSDISIVPHTPFGSPAFLNLLREGFDIYGHHGAWTDNYRSMDYRLQHAFENNTYNIQSVMKSCAQHQTQIVLTSSIFEGDTHNPPFSPYGLAKSLTTQTFFFYAQQYNVPISRFVIPNPFGPLDNPKLLHYLCKEWLEGRTPMIQTPDYIRDNIPVDLLALAYQHWIEQPQIPKDKSFRPAGYQGSMSTFAKRVSSELAPRLSLSCPLHFATQTDFSQPLRLLNQTPAQPLCPQWNEELFWDALATDILSWKNR